MTQEREAFEAWWRGLNAAPYYPGIEERIALNAWQARASLAQPASVPAGWKLVPVEPTLAMLDALRADTTPYLPDRYRAMLAASPQAPQTAQAQCTRSHPHENMSAECKALTVKAREANAAARAAPQPAQAKSRQQEIINSIKSALIRHEAATDAVIATAAGDDPHAATLAGIELEKTAALLATWTQPEYLRVMLDAAPAAPQPAPITTVMGLAVYDPPAPQPEAQPLHADPYTHVIQHLNSSPYNLTKDECIELVRKLRDSAAPSAQAEPRWVSVTEQAMQAAAKLSAPQPEAQPRWIPVEERLPPINTEVLVAFDSMSLAATGQYTGSPHDRDRQGWCYPSENSGTCDDGSDPKVTHWLPLPAAPSAQAEPYRCPAKRGEDPQVCGRVRCQLGRKCADEVQAEQGGK